MYRPFLTSCTPPMSSLCLMAKSRASCLWTRPLQGRIPASEWTSPGLPLPTENLSTPLLLWYFNKPKFVFYVDVRLRSIACLLYVHFHPPLSHITARWALNCVSGFWTTHVWLETRQMAATSTYFIRYPAYMGAYAVLFDSEHTSQCSRTSHHSCPRSSPDLVEVDLERICGGATSMGHFSPQEPPGCPSGSGSCQVLPEPRLILQSVPEHRYLSNVVGVFPPHTHRSPPLSMFERPTW